MGELVKERRDLESSHEDSLLSLDLDVPGPSEEPGEVDLGLDGSAEGEVLWGSLEQVGELALLLSGLLGSSLLYSCLLGHCD